MKRVLTIVVFFISILNAKVDVAVSIPVQKFFVKKIANDLVHVTVMLRNGENPLTYSPKPSKLKELSKSKLYFAIGVAFEQNWIDRFKSINKNLKIINTTKGIKKIPISDKKEREENPNGLDPHIWLSPKLVIIQVKTISKALQEIDPQHKSIYSKNEKNFIQEIDKIDKNIKDIISKTEQKTFIVFHPAFGYFANAYGLKQIAIEQEGKKPSIKYMKQIINYAKKNRIKTIFVAPEFSQKSAKHIAKIVGANVKSIDPLAENWEENILNIAKSFKDQNNAFK